MKVICKQCGELFTSVIIDKDKAWQEIKKTSMKHVMQKHVELFKVIASAMAIAAENFSTYLHFTEAMVVPEDQVEIQERLDLCVETVMMAIGYDATDDNDEEEDGEEGDEEEVITQEMPVVDVVQEKV